MKNLVRRAGICWVVFAFVIAFACDRVRGEAGVEGEEAREATVQAEFAEEGGARDGLESEHVVLPFLDDLLIEGEEPETSLDICPPELPSVCDWAHSADRFVLASIEDFDLVETPLVSTWYPAGAYVGEEECTLISPAIQVDLRVEEVFFGESNLDESLRVHLGYERLSGMPAMPSRDEDGRIVWSGEGRTWRAGDLVVLALHYLEGDELWSVLGEPVLWVDDQENLTLEAFLNDFDCQDVIPEGAAGMTLSELEASLSDCGEASSRAAQARRSWLRGYWTSHPGMSHAAACFRKEAERPEGSCTIHADCSGGQACVDGRCR